MKPETIMRSDLLDILFEGRNKSYGAYALRREYPKELLKSLSVVISILLILLLIEFINNGKHKINNEVVVIDHDVTPIKFVEPNRQTPPPVLKKPALPKPPASSIVNAPPVIVPNDNFIPKSPTVEELNTHVISDSTVQGTGTEASPVTAPPNTQGNGKVEQKGNSDVQPEIISAPDVAPEFPGGHEGWIRFLKRNLRPKESDEAYNVTVIINFVVNENGTLSDLKIIRSGGAEFDNEVLRVMRKSPAWNAGIYHGNKVKVYHAQPVIFINNPDE